MCVAATKQARKQFLHADVDTIEGFLEARARFLVDLADRAFERFQRSGEVGQLRIEISLTLQLFLILLNRGQIDRFEAADLLFELAELALPLRGISLSRQRFEQR